MPRVKRGFKARRRRNRLLRHAKGYYGARRKAFHVAIEQVHNAWEDAYFLITALHQGRPLHTSVWRLAGSDGLRHLTPVPLEVVASEAIPHD